MHPDGFYCGIKIKCRCHILPVNLQLLCTAQTQYCFFIATVAIYCCHWDRLVGCSDLRASMSFGLYKVLGGQGVELGRNGDKGLTLR